MRKSWVYIERRFWWIPGPKIKNSMVFNDAARLFYYGVVTESRHSNKGRLPKFTRLVTERQFALANAAGAQFVDQVRCCPSLTIVTSITAMCRNPAVYRLRSPRFAIGRVRIAKA
jgi:hypothetical protein